MVCIENLIDAQAATYIALSDSIWQHAELGYEEERSAAAHIEQLERAGFQVRTGVADIPTAFIAEAGSGGPIIGILGEYDALAKLSQESGALECKASKEIETGNGHGCGHHLLGTGAHLAAVAVKEFLETTGTPGIVRFYGCPAEEGGFGKTFMARAGLFDDLDTALTWHPGPVSLVKNWNYLAVRQAYFRFVGIAAHAGVSPHLGRSALDALELMNVGVNFLREHMPSDARVHYAITDAGGEAPNVVQASAEALYMVRSPQNAEVEELYRRVCDIARGAALMSGCELEVRFHSGCSNVVLNHPLNQLMHKHMVRLGPPPFDEYDYAFAAQLQKTTQPAEHESIARWLTTPWAATQSLFDIVDDYDPRVVRTTYGSTDVGDVSWVTPTAQCMMACFAYGTSPHSWQWVSQGKTGIAHKGMVTAAKVMAAMAIDLFKDASLLQAVREDWIKQRRGVDYQCPVPADVVPPPQRGSKRGD